MNALFTNDLCLQHLLHCVQLLALLELHAPHFAESTLANYVQVIEMQPVNLLGLDHDLVLLFLFLNKF